MCALNIAEQIQPYKFSNIGSFFGHPSCSAPRNLMEAESRFSPSADERPSTGVSRRERRNNSTGETERGALHRLAYLHR